MGNLFILILSFIFKYIFNNFLGGAFFVGGGGYLTALFLGRRGGRVHEEFIYFNFKLIFKYIFNLFNLFELLDGLTD